MVRVASLGFGITPNEVELALWLRSVLQAQQHFEGFSFLLQGTEQHGYLVSHGQSAKKPRLISTHHAFTVVSRFHPSPKPSQVRLCCEIHACTSMALGPAKPCSLDDTRLTFAEDLQKTGLGP